MNKYKIKVYPKGRGREVYRIIEIDGNKTLDYLCRTILEAFHFDMDHLYEFCMDNKLYSVFAIMPPDTKIKLDKLGLEVKQKFLLHYDFGDDWQFVVTVQEKEKTSLPRKASVIKAVGHVEQYPEYDEEY